MSVRGEYTRRSRRAELTARVCMRELMDDNAPVNAGKANAVHC